MKLIIALAILLLFVLRGIFNTIDVEQKSISNANSTEFTINELPKIDLSTQNSKFANIANKNEIHEKIRIYNNYTSLGHQNITIDSKQIIMLETSFDAIEISSD